MTQHTEDLKAVDARSTEYLEQVDEAWWNLMQGELNLTGADADEETVEIVVALTQYGIDNVVMTSESVEQVSTKGEKLDFVSEQEMAERVALALAGLCYGGGNEPVPTKLTKAEGDAIQAITGNVLDNAHDDPDWDTDEYLTQYYETDAETVLSGLNKVKEMTQS